MTNQLLSRRRERASKTERQSAMAAIDGSLGLKMSRAQFEKLIQTVRSLAPDPIKGDSKGSFANCNIRFGGQRDPDAVDEFIQSVQAYKELEHISDEDALKGISLLFARDAIAWWKGVRRQVKTWNEALELLKDHFSPAKAPYQIYLEIFETKQENDSIDTFVCKQRALLAKLPAGLHDEETELNFIYGLLALKYRERIPRHEIKTFRHLLEKGRAIEQHR